MSLDREPSARATAPLGPGILVLVVGASGAGKDALIAGARSILSPERRFAFPERTITRAPHHAEDHASVSQSEFAKAAREKRFALTWEAHGLSYALPSKVDDMIRRGETVVFNSSRAIISTARERYAHVCVVLVECPSSLRAERLALRGRETAASIEARLSRKVADFDPSEVGVRIDNSGDLQHGVDALVAALRCLPADA